MLRSNFPPRERKIGPSFSSFISTACASAALASPGSEACGGGGAVELGCGDGGGDAEFGGNPGDRGRANGEVGLAVDCEIWRDERLVVGSDLVCGVSAEERLEVPRRGVGFVVDHQIGRASCRERVSVRV